jgi:hypothetical protein
MKRKKWQWSGIFVVELPEMGEVETWRARMWSPGRAILAMVHVSISLEEAVNRIPTTSLRPQSSFLAMSSSAPGSLASATPMGPVSAWLFFLNRTNSSSSYSWSWSLCCSFCCFSSWAGLCLSLAPPRIQIPPGLEHLAFNTNRFVFFVFFLEEKAFVLRK